MKLFKPFRAFTVVLFVLLLASAYVFHNSESKIGTYIPTDGHILYIYEQLAINSGQQDIPPLIILDSPIINAWTDGNTITMTTSMLRTFENDDELALVLAHEMAHAINKDPSRGYDDVNSNDTEAHADKLGAFIMMRAGFDECRGKEIFKIFKRLFGDTANPVGHPDFAYRYDQLDLPQCHVL